MELEPRIRELYQKLFEETASPEYLARMYGLKKQEKNYTKGDEENARRN